MDAGTTVKIRQTDDVALIKRLHARTFPADEWIDERQKNWFWVVTVDGRIAGFVSCQHLREVPNLAYLERIGVLPQFSHLGLGRRLIRHVTRWAKRRGFRLITYVLTKNGPSLASFIRAGWRVYSPDYEWGGKKAVYLEST